MRIIGDAFACVALFFAKAVRPYGTRAPVLTPQGLPPELQCPQSLHVWQA